MAVRLIVDSACDILPQTAKQQGVIRLPLIVRFQNEEFADGINLTHEQFYQKLTESKELPKTSQLPPASFAEVFDEIQANHDSAVVITVSAKLSGTYQSAMLAASEYEDIHVVDSANVCIGERILLEKAIRLRDRGHSASEIAQELEQAKNHIALFALLDTLEYLKKGGRISSTTAFAGELLSIKPLVSVEAGEVKLVGKARGMKRGNQLLNEYISHCEIAADEPFYLAYSGVDDARLQHYLADSNSFFSDTPKEALPISTVGCVIGTHVGPGAIAVAFFRKS